VALVEPYLGGSHRAWAEGYAAHSQLDVDVFGLPAVHWKWRLHGAHVTLAPRLAVAAGRDGPYDVLVASSMTNLPALLGLSRRAIGDVPAVLYVHENQLTFPLSPTDRVDLTYAMVNWTSMVAADLVVFNSRFHLDDWFAALPDFLARFPDHGHGRLIDQVAAKSTVAPVGADLRAIDRRHDRVARETSDPWGRPLVLWNQRWEYDKGTAELAAAIRALVDDGVPFDVALAGERPADDPVELVALRSLLGERLVHEGYADVDDYHELLQRADVVISTAHHEFFGIAITEAVYAGAFPVLPNRLVYPERIPPEHHDACLYRDGRELVARMRWALTHRREAAAVAAALRPVMAACDWSVVAPRYDALFAGTMPLSSAG